MDADDDEQPPGEGEESSDEPQPEGGTDSFVPIVPPIKLVPPAPDLNAITRDLLAPLRESLSHLVRLSLLKIDPFEEMRASLQALAGPLQEKLRTDLVKLGEQAEKALRRHFPANWHELPVDDIDAAFEIVTNEGVPLAWTPRAILVEELIGAEDESERRIILAERAKDIADDCAAVLTEVTDPNLNELAEFATEAADCLSVGRHFSAQAGATTVVDTLLHHMVARGAPFLNAPLEKMKFGGFPDRLDVPDDETSFEAVRSTCALTPLRTVLKSYQFPSLNDPGDPMPTRLNRHVTVHQVCRAHSTPANAVVAVMLAASLLREAQEVGW
ncbi:hypothetical protein [Actinomadura sp. 3N407]|uniref:hypothetical protein n=1 Tax=Actinomadura sp. 3N407 TaxID=3457423 RepID=UPI003FCD381A